MSPKPTLQNESWNDGVYGSEAPILINTDATILRTQAGPGTGKTFAMIRRVERLLHPQGANASGKDVLVVAFNRVIAKQLREEIEERLAMIGIVERPHISTVHALCLHVIGDDLRLLLPHEREAMLYDVLTLFPKIAENYSPRAFNSVKQALKNHEAGHEVHHDLWMAVKRWLDRHSAALISDLPARLLDHLKHGDFGTRRYKYVIVDEFQDLTKAEQQLFFRLRNDGGQFFGLGDSRQSIYRFRGNDREGLLSLDQWANEEGLEVKDLPMRGCQRCTSEIVEAANKLMTLSGEESMIAAREDTGSIHVVYWDNPQAEARGMAEKIVNNFKMYPDDRHLVMTTRRGFGYILRDEIRQLDPDLSIDISFEEGLLESWPVREAFIFLTLVADLDPPTVRSWYSYKKTEDGKKYKAPSRNSDAYIKFLGRCDDEITGKDIIALSQEDRTANRGRGGANLWERAKRYVSLSDAIGEVGDRSAEQVIEETLEPSHWIIEGADDEERARRDLLLLRDKSLDILRELKLDGIKGTATLLKEMASQLRHKIATREPFLSDESADLQISTMWGAKGVTADHVYVLGLCDEAIPGSRRDEYPGTDAEYINEQRRLFYVTITRTKDTLVLSRAKKVKKGEARTLGLHIRNNWWNVGLTRTRFLREIQELLPDAVNGDEWGWPG